MMRARSGIIGAGHVSAALAAVVLAAGCGKKGPEKYAVSGVVKYGDQPIKSGDIRFEPKEGLKNLETMIQTRILDGRYSAEIVGGPHLVHIRDLTGDVDMGDPSSAGGKPLFQMEYHGEVDFPAASDVKDGKPVEKDIAVPTTHK